MLASIYSFNNSVCMIFGVQDTLFNVKKLFIEVFFGTHGSNMLALWKFMFLNKCVPYVSLVSHLDGHYRKSHTSSYQKHMFFGSLFI